MPEVISIRCDSHCVARITPSEKAFDPIAGMEQRMMLRNATIAHVQRHGFSQAAAIPRAR
jgi:hypothetical protein